MKEIVIVTNQMIRGGVETALISMLNAIDLTQTNVSVLLLRRGGVWEKRIPKSVQVAYVDELENPKKYLKTLVMRGHPFAALRKMQLFYRSINARNYWMENHLLAEFLPEVQKKYDVAIAYHAPGTLPVHYVLNNIKADNKVLWIHGDVEKTKSTGGEYRRLYLQYDRIVCVSKEAERIFLKYFPETKAKCQTVHNVIDTKHIDNAIREKQERYTICTVARLSPEKGIDLAIETCAKLIQKHPNIRWCVCGGGTEEGKLRQKIADKRLEDNFILLGDQDNPYKYVMYSDIYVQPSFHEGYCMTIAEARYLCKPIVATCTSGALEQLTDGVDGTIVDMNPCVIADAIERLLSDRELCDRYISQLKQIDWDSDSDRIAKVISF